MAKDVAVGNGGTKPAQAAFVLSYNQGTKSYELDQTLQPDDQMWIDVGNLIRQHIPDKSGNVLPENVAMGSYEVRELTHKGIGSLFEGKVVYDKTYGHVTYGCASCCAEKLIGLFYDPLGIPDLGTAGQGVQATDACTGHLLDISSDFDFSRTTANHAIATVDAYGTHTGQSEGTTSTLTCAQEQIEYRWDSCPVVNYCPGGQDNVQVPKYFFSPSAAQTSTLSLCVQQGGKGYFIDVSYYVADATSNRVSKSGMAPGENLSDGKGWNDAYATPPTTRSDGSFDDTPFGACYFTLMTHYCEAGSPQSFRLTDNGTVFPIMTNTTSNRCTDGIQLVIQGNPSTPVNQNKTYTLGNTK